MKRPNARDGDLADFSDQTWDFMDRETRDVHLLELMRRQILFAATTTKFWRDRIDVKRFTDAVMTRDLLEGLPILDKRLLRLYHHEDFLPDSGGPFHVVRGTGGTTGVPVPVFWGLGDWRAAIDAAVRCAGVIADMAPKVIWNGYNQAHSSGPSFDDIARGLGATPVPRHFRSGDREAIDEIAKFRAKVLVITPKSGSGKGGSLEDFLAIDQDFISRLGIEGLIVSSTALENDLLEEITSQGIKGVVNFYGSTEALPAAASCTADPQKFHLCYGPNFIEVVDEFGRHVKDGGEGMVVVSRIAAYGSTGAGVVARQSGSQILRYLVGDAVSYDESSCSCGRTTPRIFGIRRVVNQEDKLLGGCEKWE